MAAREWLWRGLTEQETKSLSGLHDYEILLQSRSVTALQPAAKRSINYNLFVAIVYIYSTRSLIRLFCLMYEIFRAIWSSVLCSVKIKQTYSIHKPKSRISRHQRS